MGEPALKNAYALVCREGEADGGSESAPLPSRLEGENDVDWRPIRILSRPEWAGLQKDYGLSFRAQRQMPAGLHVGRGWPTDEVDVIAGLYQRWADRQITIWWCWGFETRDYALVTLCPATRRRCFRPALAGGAKHDVAGSTYPRWRGQFARRRVVTVQPSDQDAGEKRWAVGK